MAIGKFHLSPRSLRQLQPPRGPQVHPLLVRAVNLAITYTTVDFGILEGGGIRTPDQARANVQRKTGVLNSLHLPQDDGFGHAVDLIPWVDGKFQWDTRYHEHLRTAMFRACDEIELLIQNGADWDIDGIYGEPGENDWYHFQIPNIPLRVFAASDARENRLAAQSIQELPSADLDEMSFASSPNLALR